MRIKRFCLFFCLYGLLATLPAMRAQTAPEKLPDGKAKQQETIEFSEIPIKSVEVINQARQAFHDLIPINTIRNLRVKNVKLLASIDTNLLKPLDADDPAINLRFLENRKLSLEQEQRKIEQETTKLNEVNTSLDQLTNWLNQQALVWKNTQKLMLRDSLSRPVPEKVTFTVAFLDSSLNLIGKKTEAMVEMLERTISIGVNIDLYIEKTVALITRKQMQAFTSDHLPFFRLNFRTDYGSEILQSLKSLKNVRAKELQDYLVTHLDAILFLFILLGAMVWFFIVLRKRIHINLEGFGQFYKKMLLVILARPVSAAAILVMISSILMLSDRPIIFRDALAYIIAYPLLILLNTILGKKYHVYLYTFSVVIVLYMVLVLLASETVIYRMMLLLIALAEIGMLCLFIISFRHNQLITLNQKRWVYFFMFLHLILAVTGLISNLAGRLILTEMALNAVFVNILNGVILFVTVIIVNGLVASGIDSHQGQKLNSFRKYGELIKQRSIQILNTLTIIFWITLLLKAFRISGYVYNLIGSIFTYRFSLGSAGFSLDLIVIFFVVIYIFYWLATLLRVILEEDVLIRLPLSKGLPHTIAMGVKYSLIVAGFLLAVNAAGIPMDKLTIILGAFSVGIGFGLQNIFSNMVSGLILLFERPIQLGDTVQVGQLTGNVKSIDLRSSNIQTFDGAEVIVPNGQLVSNEVINWTLSDKRRRIEIMVGVGYESDPPFVHQLLSEILKNHPEVLDEPEPLVFFNGLGESSLDFVLLFWIGNYNEGRRIKSEVLFSVFSVLKENNVNIPFPQRDVHIRTVNGEVPDKE
jgi:small-conductance mechanosensitive channel